MLILKPPILIHSCPTNGLGTRLVSMYRRLGVTNNLRFNSKFLPIYGMYVCIYVCRYVYTVLTRTYAPPFCRLDLAKSMGGGAYN